MILTVEQRNLLTQVLDDWLRAGRGNSLNDHVFLAGYRLGFEAAREAAAKACEALRYENGEKVAADEVSTEDCAEAIRAIPLPGGEK